MTMTDVMMADISCTQNEVSVSGEWPLGILLGALITSALWYIFYLGIEKKQENKLTI